MRTALKPGTIITINGIQYRINNLLSVSGGMSLIYEAQQQVESSGYAGRTIIKEFFPATNAARDDQGHVYCVSQDPEDIHRFEQMRQDLVNEGIIGEEARNACSQVYAFDHSSDGYAVMREFSRDTRSLADLLNVWQKTPPSSDEEYTDMARVRYALRIAHSLLTGLKTIHESAGIIHRDISLGNIVWASSDIEKTGLDGRAYYLDFGSALRMDAHRESRNTTDPLKLFGTYSFAAPEIWQLGGTLTPSVDLFSISAVLLVLCCGKKCCIRMKQGWHLASQANISRLYESDFVVRSAVEKLNIPAEIRGMLLDYLLEGLSKSPEMRFNQSPDKMLESLERLQKKCAPRQRLREYAAFISYHHRPLDILVARRLHHMIEQYRIPRELSKGRESRRLGLVFRDEDELPVSTDLTDNIQEALDHSDFLIVICTPGTPKSIWVEAEIEYFLRHHDRNHVLAVLAEGRPEESFPPHLVHLYDREGNVIGDTEYLAANIAGANKREVLRNLSREKLRIIAAMIGCPYDSLVQRERRYRTRRVAAIACLSAFIAVLYIGMLLQKNRQISERNEEITRQNQQITGQMEQITQQNQQITEQIDQITQQNAELKARETDRLRLLANEAESMQQEGDDYAAVKDCLEILPAAYDLPNCEANASKAESLLLRSMGTFNTEDQLFGKVQTFTQDYDIAAAQYICDNVLLTIDHYGHLNAFNANNGEVLWSTQMHGRLSDEPSAGADIDVTLYSNGNGIVICNYMMELSAFDKDGSCLWTRYSAYNNGNQSFFSLSKDGRRFAYVDGDYHNGSGNQNNGSTLIICSVETGNTMGEYILSEGEELKGYVYFQNGTTCISGYSDGSSASARRGTFSDDGSRYYLAAKINDRLAYYSVITDRSVAGNGSSRYSICYADEIGGSEEDVIAIEPLGDSLIVYHFSGETGTAGSVERIDLSNKTMVWQCKLNHAMAQYRFTYSAACYLRIKEYIYISSDRMMFAVSATSGDMIGYDYFSNSIPVHLATVNDTYGLVELTSSNGLIYLMWANGRTAHFNTTPYYGLHFADTSYIVPAGNSVVKPESLLKVSFTEDDTTGVQMDSIYSNEGVSMSIVSNSAPRTIKSLGLHKIAGASEKIYRFEGFNSLNIDSNDSFFGEPPAFNANNSLVFRESVFETGTINWLYFDRDSHQLIEAVGDSAFPHIYETIIPNDYAYITEISPLSDSLTLTNMIDGNTTILAEQSNDNEDIAQLSASASVRRSGDGSVLTVLYDGEELRLWNNGAAAGHITVPEPAQHHDYIYDSIDGELAVTGAYKTFSYNYPLAIGGNGYIIIPEILPVEGEAYKEYVNAYYAYNTANGEWVAMDDASHIMSYDRTITLGQGKPLMAAVGNDGIIRIYNLDGANLLAEIPTGQSGISIFKMAFVLDDNYILVNHIDSHTTMLFSVDTGAKVLQEDLDSYSIISDSEQHRAYLFREDGEPTICYDMNSWIPLCSIPNAVYYDTDRDEIYYYDKAEKTLSFQKIPPLTVLLQSSRDYLSILEE